MSEQEQEKAVAGVGILVAAFPEENAGEEALKALKQARKQRQVYFEDAAVIRQDAEGGVHYHETGDMSTGKGAGAGAIVGGLIGILGGPAGIVIGAGAGALVGGALAHGDAGFADDSLEQLGVALKPGTSAVALVTSGAFLHAVRKQADDAQLREALGNIGSELSARLEEGKSVALGMVLTEEGIAVQEVAANNEVAEVIGVVVTEDGVLAGEAVATEEGAAYAVAATDGEAVEYEVGAATEDAAAVEHGVVTEEGAIIAGAAATEDEAVEGVAVITPVEEEAGEDEEKKEE
ncbi:MAG: DUF1269 domain-containing protein [Chloroflexi bacterium]|jgi:uncharacterized membrane protein|nr:DUF1269 domain-containing protein [Chloroflexota bacterium]